MTIPFRAASGLQSHYTPDFLVLYKDQTASLHEIKYRDELRANWEELRPRFRAAFRHARVSGMRFSIQTEVKIRSPKLNNIKFLRPYARQEPNTEVEGHLITALGRIGESSVRDLIAAVRSAPEGQSQVLPHVWRLLALHRIHAELSVPLTMDTALTVSRSA